MRRKTIEIEMFQTYQTIMNRKLYQVYKLEVFFRGSYRGHTLKSGPQPIHGPSEKADPRPLEKTDPIS